MAHFLRNIKIKRPMRPSCPDPGRLGREGRLNSSYCGFIKQHHHDRCKFRSFKIRGIEIREIVVGMMLLFYGKAIVEYENWLSQSMYYFSKRSIVSRFPKAEGAVHDRDIAGIKLSGFPPPADSFRINETNTQYNEENLWR